VGSSSAEGAQRTVRGGGCLLSKDVFFSGISFVWVFFLFGYFFWFNFFFVVYISLEMTDVKLLVE
jgi:hypothetical protein